MGKCSCDTETTNDLKIEGDIEQIHLGAISAVSILT